jgi:hypothetical protein
MVPPPPWLSPLCYADAAWDWRVCSGMLRHCSCIAFAVILVSTAQAADTTLTLACKGKEETSQGGARKSSEVINIGIIVDLQKKTLVGLEPTVTLTVDSVTETTISFSGAQGGWFVSGILDRVTGSLIASSGRSNGPTTSHDLQCRPAQRMF